MKTIIPLSFTLLTLPFASFAERVVGNECEWSLKNGVRLSYTRKEQGSKITTSDKSPVLSLADGERVIEAQMGTNSENIAILTNTVGATLGKKESGVRFLSFSRIIAISVTSGKLEVRTIATQKLFEATPWVLDSLSDEVDDRRVRIVVQNTLLDDRGNFIKHVYRNAEISIATSVLKIEDTDLPTDSMGEPIIRRKQLKKTITESADKKEKTPIK